VNQRAIKSWPLLALCGICDAIFAIIIVSIGPNGPLAPHTAAQIRGIMETMGGAALAAGACTIAAGLWTARKRKSRLPSTWLSNSWLLVLNGLACGALGTLVMLGMSRPVAFRTIALLIVAMAVSIGWFELAGARTLRGLEEWLLAGAGVVSVGFAGVFLGFVTGWIRLRPSPSGQTFYWLAAYFAFSAICMLGLAVGQVRPPASMHGLRTGILPTA